MLDLMPIASNKQWLDTCVDLASAGLLYGIGSFLFVVALRWPLVGRYKKRAADPFVWLSEAITNLYEAIAVPNFPRHLRGTPWLPAAWRLLGARIGSGVYLDTTDVTEFDCVSIGAHSETQRALRPPDPPSRTGS